MGHENDILIMHLTKSEQSIKDRADMIDATPWSNGMDWWEIETLAEFMRAYVAPENTVIMKEGASEKFMCLLIKGQVKILKNAKDQTDNVIRTLGRGNAIGEMALIDGEPRSASVVAQSESLLLILTEERFLLLLDRHPGLGVKLVIKVAKLISQRLRQTSGKLVEFLGQD